MEHVLIVAETVHQLQSRPQPGPEVRRVEVRQRGGHGDVRGLFGDLASAQPRSARTTGVSFRTHKGTTAE
jgi:hypothetical protein